MKDDSTATSEEKALSSSISFFSKCNNSTPTKTVTVKDVLTDIQNGTYKETVEDLRSILEQHGHDAYDTARKKQLVCVVFQGTFVSTRSKENLAQASGVTVFDFDRLTHLPRIISKLTADPYVLFCFVSVSGHGLKVGVQIPIVESDAEYKQYWQAIADYFQKTHDLTADPSGKDVSRLCFMSHDPNLYINEQAEVWTDKAEDTEQETSRSPLPRDYVVPLETNGDRRQEYGQRAIDTAIKKLDASTDGNRHHARCRAGFLIGGYIEGGMLTLSEALQALEPAVRRNTKHFDKAWRTIQGQLKAGANIPVSFEQLETERLEWLNDGASWTLNGNGDDQQNVHERPIIKINHEMTRIVDAGESALMALLDGPHIFQRSRQLVIIARNQKPPRGIKRPPGAPNIIEAPGPYIKELATAAATWEKYEKRSKKWYATLPPGWFVETLQGRPSWSFPWLEGIVSAPTLRPNGSILDTAGYDEETGLYFDTNGTTFPAIPAQPTFDEVRTAIGTLSEVFYDFPFEEEYHSAAALTATLSLVGRFGIDGNIPLFAVRSTVRGSGKGLLVDAISTIATGRPAPRMPQAKDDEEERKRLLAICLEGDPLMLIDNVTEPLGNGPLDLAITAGTFKDRILGKTATREAPVYCMFFATGNNMRLIGDMARRVVPIDLDPKLEHPELRDDFTHPSLLTWIMKERPRLVTAALSILRGFIVEGCPNQGVKPIGSFEHWSQLVRNAVIWAGEPDPALGREGLEAASDENFERYATLIECWTACFPDPERPRTLKQILTDVQQRCQGKADDDPWSHFMDALGAFDKNYDGERLKAQPIGQALRQFDRRPVNGRRLKKIMGRAKTQLWRVETI